MVLSGVTSRGYVGAIAPSRSKGITGNSATGAVGTVTVVIGGNITLELTGVFSTCAVGTVKLGMIGIQIIWMF
jgi:hypothetical protein